MKYFKFSLIVIILSSFQLIEAENNDEYKILETLQKVVKNASIQKLS